MNEMQIGWFAAIIVGGFAGWFASMFMNTNTGVLMNILMGVVGAALANFLLRLANISVSGGWLSYLAVGFVGACILIGLARAVRGRA